MDGLEKNKNKKWGALETPPTNSEVAQFSPNSVEDGTANSEFTFIDENETVGPGSDFNYGVPPASQNPDDSQKSQEEPKNEEKKEEEAKKEDESESNSSEHDGKYFVIQKGMCKCDQGFKFPKFKVTSHQKHYWNDAEGEADYLAVTEDDLMLDPPAMPFGNCKLQPTTGGYLPCSYAPVGKWTKTYEKVKVMGHSCLTEISELQCAIGGKITIMKHGQQSEAGKSNVAKADANEQQVYNPLMDYEEFQEQVNSDNTTYYE